MASREWKKNFNRTNERDYVPCVREWEERGLHVMQVVRTSSSGTCYRSIVLRDRLGKIVGSHSTVTQAGQTVSAASIWRDLAKGACVKLPSASDPTQHISMTSGPTRSYGG